MFSEASEHDREAAVSSLSSFRESPEWARQVPGATPGAGLRKQQGKECARNSETLHLPRGPGSAWWGRRFLPHGYRAALLYSEMIHSVTVLNPLYISGSQMVFAPQETLGSVEGQCLHTKTRGRMLLASSKTTDAGSTSYRYSQRAVRPKHPHGQGYSTGSSIMYTCICVYIHTHTIMYMYYIYVNI